MEAILRRYCGTEIKKISRSRRTTLSYDQWGKICLSGLSTTENTLKIHNKPSFQVIGSAFSSALHSFNSFLLTSNSSMGEEARKETIERAKEVFSLSIIELIKTYSGDINAEFTEPRSNKVLNLLGTSTLLSYENVCNYLIRERNADVNHIIKGTGPVYYCCRFWYQQAWLGDFQQIVPGYMPAMMILFRSLENREFLISKRNEGYDFASLRDSNGWNVAFYATDWSSDEDFAFIQYICDIHHVANDGNTAITYAMRLGNYVYANKLIDAGVRPDKPIQVSLTDILRSLDE